MTALITAARLFALAPNAREDIVQPLALALEQERERFGVISSGRTACCVAQIAIESAGFRRLEENLDYSAERIGQVWPRLNARGIELEHNPKGLANAAYAFKNGNGTEVSGDGFKFKGRGPIQITGADNYKAAQRGTGEMVFLTPDLAARPDVGAKIALWFFQSRGCNELADAGDVDGITRKINGPAMEQANARRQLTEKALAIFV